MVTPIDAVGYGIGLDEAGRWQDATPAMIPALGNEAEYTSAARGTILGIAVSGALWTGLFMAGRLLLNLMFRP